MAWEGDCLEVVRSFPKPIREDLGAEIRRLQLGEKPMDSRPMKSIGRGVFELRQRDENGWYRLVYLTRVRNTLYMLHAFVKKSAKTSQRDLSTAKTRLQAVRKRLAQVKKR